jgi:hypothetical protein
MGSEYGKEVGSAAGCIFIAWQMILLKLFFMYFLEKIDFLDSFGFE